MCSKSEMEFSIFLIHQMAEFWHKTTFLYFFHKKNKFFIICFDKKSPLIRGLFCDDPITPMSV